MADRTFKLAFLGDASKAMGEIDKLGGAFGKMSTGTKVAVGAAIAGGTAIGAATAGGLLGAIKVAASYEKQIGAVAAASQASASEQRQLFETGKRIGRDTTFSAVEAAQAMELLAQNGVSTADIIGGATDAVVALAAATGKDMVTAAGAASQALTIWKIPMKEMPDLINRAAGAALVGKFDVEDLSLAMGQGGGVAMSAGVEWRDFFTTIAAGSDLFTSGADAGTSYKSFINSLTPNTKKAIAMMQQLWLMTDKGTNLFYDQNGALKDGAAMAGLLQKATKGLTEEQRSLAFETLFGTDGARTAIALARAGAEGYQKMGDTMKNTDAAAIAAKRMDNLMGAAERFAGAIESLQLRITPILGPMAKGVDFLADAIGKIPTPALVAFAAVGLFIGALSAFAAIVLPIALLASTLGLSIGAVSLAFLAIPAAIFATIAAYALLFVYWDQVIAKAATVRDAIMNATGVPTTGASGAASKTLINKGAQALLPLIPGGAGIGFIASLKQALGVAPPTGFGASVGEFASGGIVPGPSGAPQLAIVHGGERVIPNGGGGNYYFSFNLGGFIGASAEFQRAFLEALTVARQRGVLPT